MDWSGWRRQRPSGWLSMRCTWNRRRPSKPRPMRGVRPACTWKTRLWAQPVSVSLRFLFFSHFFLLSLFSFYCFFRIVMYIIRFLEDTLWKKVKIINHSFSSITSCAHALTRNCTQCNIDDWLYCKLLAVTHILLHCKLQSHTFTANCLQSHTFYCTANCL